MCEAMDLIGSIFVLEQKSTYLWFADFDCADIIGEVTSRAFNYSDPDKLYSYSCSLALKREENGFISLTVMLEDKFENPSSKEVRVAIMIWNRTASKSICEDNPVYSKTSPKDHRFSFSNLVERDQLVNQKGFLLESVLLIEFSLTVALGGYKNAEFEEHQLKRKRSAAGGHDLGHLFASGRFSDVQVMVENKEFRLHKCVLASRSRVFSTMFEIEMKESRENTVKIDDFSFEVMKELFRFVYSFEVENIERLAGELLAAANKYELDDLKSKCEKVLIKSLNTDNVFDLYVVADRHEAAELKSSVNQFLLENAKDVVSSARFSDLLQQRKI